MKRAILKKDDKAYYLLLGIENQSEVHYAMPVRNMVYDALNYASQVSEAAKRHKENDEYGTSAEFLSGFHKDDRLTPVITLVIYWEDGAWDGPRSIHEMLNQTDPKLLKYVSDYKIHMIVPDEVEDFAKFQTELRTVLRFMSVKDEKEKLKSMVNTYRGEYSQVDAESAKVLNACAGVKLTHKVTEGGYDVCKGIEDMKKEELERGLAVGSAETLVQNVEALSQNMKLSVEAACAAVNASYETYLEAKALLAK